MKLYILNQNCTMAGRQADDDRAYDNCGDVTVYEDSPKGLLKIAEGLASSTRTGGNKLYDIKVASTIREAVYFEFPDLEPAEADDA